MHITGYFSIGEHERAIREIDYYVQRDVAGGFRARDEIITNAAEVLADDSISS